MANPFVKGWKYMMALFGAKIDEHADPKIQIQQAIEEAQKQHQALVGQAASVIGNQRQLEMKLNRSMSEVERLQAQARQALVLSDKARADGDEAKAQQFESTAEILAGQLVSTEQSLEDMKVMHDQALTAADQAKKAVENNQMILQQKLQERTKLLGQLEQAKMQETIASSLESMSQTAAPGNVPNFDEIRDKIEGRYSNAMGRAELASNSVEGRLLEVNRATRDMAGVFAPGPDPRVPRGRSALGRQGRSGDPVEGVGHQRPPRRHPRLACRTMARPNPRPRPTRPRVRQDPGGREGPQARVQAPAVPPVLREVLDRHRGRRCRRQRLLRALYGARHRRRRVGRPSPGSRPRWPSSAGSTTAGSPGPCPRPNGPRSRSTGRRGLAKEARGLFGETAEAIRRGRIRAQFRDSRALRPYERLEQASIAAEHMANRLEGNDEAVAILAGAVAGRAGAVPARLGRQGRRADPRDRAGGQALRHGGEPHAHGRAPRRGRGRL